MGDFIIYDVIHQIWDLAFPPHIYVQYMFILETISFFLTLIVLFGFILIPLWRIATFFLPKLKRS